MKSIGPPYKTLLLLGMAVISALNGLAQQLVNTNWKSSGKEPVRLHLSKDTALVNGRGNLSFKFPFFQKHDTLFLFDQNSYNRLSPDSASYKIRYRNNSQQLILSAINEHRVDRKNIFASVIFDYVAEQGGAFRDWSYRDAVADSIAESVFIKLMIY